MPIRNNGSYAGFVEIEFDVGFKIITYFHDMIGQSLRSAV